MDLDREFAEFDKNCESKFDIRKFLAEEYLEFLNSFKLVMPLDISIILTPRCGEDGRVFFAADVFSERDNEKLNADISKILLMKNNFADLLKDELESVKYARDSALAKKL